MHTNDIRGIVKLMDQKGFAPIFITLILFGSLVGGVFLVNKQTNFFSKAFNYSPIKNTIDESSSSGDLSLGNLLNKASGSPTVQSTSNNQNVKSPVPKSTPKPTLKPTPTSPPKTLATCLVNALVSSDNPLTVNFHYGLNLNGLNAYATDYQWDYDGNGSWDTDFSKNNTNINYTYPRQGSYNVKLQVKLSNGQVTDVCTKSINVPVGIQVSFTGTVFKDVNCNDMREPSEQGISGMVIRFFKQEGGLYKNVTSDGSGNYNLTTNLPTGDSLTIQPSPDLNNGNDPSIVTMSAYKIHYNVPYATLNQNQSSINKDVPLVPTENISSCTQ